MSFQKLYHYALSSCFEHEALLHSEFLLARVTEQQRHIYTVVAENGEFKGSVSGNFSFHAGNNTAFPVVGDWVMVSLFEGKEPHQQAVIHHILTRKNTFERKAAGTHYSTQIIAANIDIIFICSSLNNDFNLRRLERYLSIAWESSATPVIVLTKSDLCSDVASKLAEIATMSMGADVIVTSILDRNDTRQQLLSYVRPERTVVFLGSSGVGKSSLVNLLLDTEVLLTQEVGNDDSGKHTTTHRQLFVVPSGGVVIDTPGMRELQLDTGNLSKAFEDVEQLSLQCKYRNCSHTSEKGCAVQQAITEGSLSEGRLDNYRKLEKEVQYEGLNAKQREHAKIKNMFGSLGEFKQFKQKTRQINNKRNHGR